jgi:hypothetical protein
MLSASQMAFIANRPSGRSTTVAATSAFLPVWRRAPPWYLDLQIPLPDELSLAERIGDDVHNLEHTPQHQMQERKSRMRFYQKP